MRDFTIQSLSYLFKSIELKEIFKDDVRNAMEHFDERLDKLSMTIEKNSRKKNQNIAYNMVFSEKNVMIPFPTPVRIYISKEKKFHIFGITLDLGEISEESKRILNILNNDPRRKKYRNPVVCSCQ